MNIFKNIFLGFLFILMAISSSIQVAHSQTQIDSILTKTFKQIDLINTLRFNIISRERINNDYKIDKGFYKISKKPILFYYKQIIPATGAEVFVNNETYPMALVNANKTLVPTLKLSPFGEILRDTRHHNLCQAGYDYFKNILLFFNEKYNIKWSNVSTLEDNIKINNNNCYKLTIINNNYKIFPFTVKEKTTPQQLALKLNICDYSILQHNSIIKSIFSELHIGQIINIPNDYAYKIILFIDKSLYLPVKIQVFDNIGLFEEYIFENIEVNPIFNKNEYLSNYKDYGF